MLASPRQLPSDPFQRTQVTSSCSSSPGPAGSLQQPPAGGTGGGRMSGPAPAPLALRSAACPTAPRRPPSVCPATMAQCPRPRPAPTPDLGPQGGGGARVHHGKRVERGSHHHAELAAVAALPPHARGLRQIHRPPSAALGWRHGVGAGRGRDGHDCSSSGPRRPCGRQPQQESWDDGGSRARPPVALGFPKSLRNQGCRLGA